MGKSFAAAGFGPLSLGSLSTAGWTGDWYKLPGCLRIHMVELVFAGSTGVVTGSVALQGAVSTGSAATITLGTYASTQAIHTKLMASTSNSLASVVRLYSTGLASTASTGTPVLTVTGKYLGVP